MNAKTMEAVLRHGNTLLAAFPSATEKDPVALCKKLRRIETAIARPILDYTNGTNGMTEEKLTHETEAALLRCGKLLGLDEGGIAMAGLFINRDPRGYALKLDNESDWFKHWQQERNKAGLPLLYCDWGQYGIIAPDLTES